MTSDDFRASLALPPQEPPTSNDPQLFDVVAVNLTTYAERTIDTGLTARDAEGLIDACVARRGVDDEIFKAVPACPAPPRMGNVAVAMVQEAAAITQESDAETSPRYRTLAWSQQGYSLYGRPTPEPPPFTPPFSAWLCAVVPAGWDVIFVRELRQIRPEDGRVDMEVTIQRRGDEMVAATSPEMPVIEAGDDVIYRSKHAGQPDEEMSGLLISEAKAWQDDPCVVGIRRTIWTRAEEVIPMDTLGDAYLHEQARIRECHSTRRWHLQRLHRERALKEMIHGDPVEEKR